MNTGGRFSCSTRGDMRSIGEVGFDECGDCIERKRVREKRQWGVTFYSYSKQTLHF